MQLKFRAFLWIFVGLLLAIVLILYGTEERDERLTWPLYDGLVIEAKVIRAAMQTDGYELFLKLKVNPKNDVTFTTSIVQSGRKGALEKRAKEYLTAPKWLQIRINPKNGLAVLNPRQSNIGVYLLASLAFLFIGGNGFTLLFAREDKR